METKDWIYLLGLVISLFLGMYGAAPQFRRLKSQNRVDDTQSEGAAFELAENYGKKILELQKKVDNMESMLEGSLHLVVKIPLGDVFKNGSATLDNVTAEIVKHRN